MVGGAPVDESSASTPAPTAGEATRRRPSDWPTSGWGVTMGAHDDDCARPTGAPGRMHVGRRARRDVRVAQVSAAYASGSACCATPSSWQACARACRSLDGPLSVRYAGLTARDAYYEREKLALASRSSTRTSRWTRCRARSHGPRRGLRHPRLQHVRLAGPRHAPTTPATSTASPST